MNLAEIQSEITESERHLEKLKELIAVRNEINELNSQLGGPRRTIEQITLIVADHFKVPVSEILSRKRPAVITLPRQIVYYIANEIMGYGSNYIGRELKRDHGSICWGVQAIKNRRDTDPQFASELFALIKTCTEPQP